MSKVESDHEIVLRRQPALVASALASGDLAHAWRAGVIASRQVEPGPVRVGVHARVWRKQLGAPIATTWTLSELEPGRRVVWTRDGIFSRSELRFELVAEGRGTRVRARVSQQGGLRGWRGLDGDAIGARVEADLAGLRRWLDDGQHGYPTLHDHSVGARILGATLGRDATVDLRAAMVSAEVLGLELDRRHATCGMYCVFCPRTAAHEPRDLAAPDASTQASILEQFTRALDALTTPELTMWSDDLLRYPGLMPLLDRAAQRGVRVVMHTPGLALAERSFAARFVGRAVVFDLTVHAHDAATFTAMCGNPAAHGQVFAALDNLQALGIAFKVGIVVTDRNVGSLGATIGTLIERYAPERISVRVFYPDSAEGNAAYEDQFPDFSEITAQLRQVAERPGRAQTEIALSNLPPCQLDPGDIRALRVRLIPNLNAVRIYPFQACEGCPARSVCSGVHPRYAKTHTTREPDRARLADVLAQCARPR